MHDQGAREHPIGHHVLENIILGGPSHDETPGHQFGRVINVFAGKKEGFGFGRIWMRRDLRKVHRVVRMGTETSRRGCD